MSVRDRDTAAINWSDATSLLDANLHFRSRSDSSDGRRSYRASANGPALDIWRDSDLLLIGVPLALPELEDGIGPNSSSGNGGRYEYTISSQSELQVAIRALGGKGAAVREKSLEPDDQEDSEKLLIETTVKNLILYGPPGTGKTYETVRAAVEICDGTASSNREELKHRYDELQSQGRIRLVTFHQSYGYEEFIEGLRPEVVDGQVTYSVRRGVFREICSASRRSERVAPGLKGKSLQQRAVFKMSLGRAGTTEGNHVFQECMERGCVLLGWGQDIDFSECGNADDFRKRVDEDRPNIDRPDSQAGYVRAFKIDLRIGDIIIVSHGNRAFRAIAEVTGEYEYTEVPIAGRFHQMRAVRWLAALPEPRPVEEIYKRAFIQSTLYKLDQNALKLESLDSIISDRNEDVRTPFVLIIDEINRANISKVFGELITLLEPDKREGEENSLTVTLPYSGDDFSVPSNLYVVGTMNTADRSIALLDTALRRRFQFRELQPNPDLLHDVDGVDLKELLRAMNGRIELLYDRNHTIGHAYFIKVKTLRDLEAVFRQNVIPLLQEYFYEDWGKIRAILNDKNGSFVVTHHGQTELDSFANEHDAKARYSVATRQIPVSAYRGIYMQE